MSNFKARWLPDGEVDLVEIPVEGENEVRALTMRYRELEALSESSGFIDFAGAILATRRLLKLLGVKHAKDAWDSHMGRTMGKAAFSFIWPEAEFEERLAANHMRIWRQQLGCASDAEDEEHLKRMGKENEEALKRIDQKAIDEMAARPLIVLYWRLRASRVKAFDLPSGPYVPNWSLDDDGKAKAAVLRTLAQNVTREELAQLQPKMTRPIDMAEVKLHTAADVEGKSEPQPEPANESSASSAPSSAASTATTPPSA